MGYGVEISGTEQSGEEITENRDDFFAGIFNGLCLEDIEEHRQHVLIEVLLVFTPDLFGEVVDLRLVEEIQCRLEIREVDDGVGPGSSAILAFTLVGRVLLDGLDRKSVV
jgi:hypothetical protein